VPVVTLLSDFGTRDGFAAAMKAVIFELAPDVQLIDATHDIPPGDVEAAAWTLAQYWKLFPAGTVHLAVVDPGVGSRRRAIALSADGRWVVAPDNGLVTEVLDAAETWRCVEIVEARYSRPNPSATFHGRDIFAPAAAHLADGVPLERLGPSIDDPLRLEREPPSRTAGEVRGRIAHVDRFGNLITNIPGDWVDGAWWFAVGEAAVDVGSLRRTYSDADEGALLAVIGSAGTVEVAARGASAARLLDAKRGDPVIGRHG
jgi:S-adenosylmethionine hydrolase